MLKTHIVELEYNKTIRNRIILNTYKVIWVTSEKKYDIQQSMYKMIDVTLPKDNNKGVPQGGIISPLLINWTLDGLSHVARTSSVEKFFFLFFFFYSIF